MAAVVVAGGAIVAVIAANGSSDDNHAQDSSPYLVSALTPSANAHALSNSGAEPTAAQTPHVAGYQVVVAPGSGAAYDVPADWIVAPKDSVDSFGSPPDTITGKGVAREGKSYCPGSTRTMSFLTGSKTTDSATAATEIGTRTAILAYHSTTATPGAAQPLNSLDGTQRGIFAETRGTIAAAVPGCATEYSIYTYATPAEDGSLVMVIAADTGVPNAVDVATAQRIFTSVRPYQG